jgi:endonuclease/exonuclease/phosphatase family metal-dependent hydrolase
VVRILTFNTALQDVSLLGLPVYRPCAFTSERLRALPAALRALDADIVCLQECPQPAMQRRLCAALADVYPHVAGLTRRGPRLRLGCDLLILSRYPLSAIRHVRFDRAATEEQLFTSLGLLQASVRLPSGRHVRLITFHTSAGGVRRHPESAAMELIRAQQIEQILDAARGPDPVVLAGDLNAGPEASPVNYRQVLAAGFSDAFAAAGAEGITWDPGNPLVADGAEWHLPPQRIDHVLVNSAARRLQEVQAARIVLAERSVAAGLDRQIPLSDHYGVLVAFRANGI